MKTFGQESDIAGVDDNPPRISRLKENLRQLRYHSGIEQCPYEGGIEDLRTTLICTLNCMLDLVAYLEKELKR